MRKFTKILTLALSLLLLCGLVVVGAFADDAKSSETFAYRITTNTNGVETLVKDGTDITYLMKDYYTYISTYSNLKITLGQDYVVYDSVSYSSYKGFNVSAGKTLEFDLNGYDIYHNIVGASDCLFNLRTNTKLHVYSSRPGADLISLSSESNTSIVTVSTDMKNATIVFGDEEKTNNLTVHTSVFFYGYGSATLRLLGGSYLCSQSNSSGFIIARSGVTTTLDVDGAFIGNNVNKVAALFVARADTNTAYGNFAGTIKNSTVVGNRIFSGWDANSSVTVTDTDLVGGTNAGEGSVKIGHNCRMNFALAKGMTLADGCTSQTVKSSGEAIAFTVYHPTYNASSAGTGNYDANGFYKNPVANNWTASYTSYVSSSAPTLTGEGSELDYVIKSGETIVVAGRDNAYLLPDYNNVKGSYNSLTIVLGADYDATNGSFKLPTGKTLNFDLGGYDIEHIFSDSMTRYVLFGFTGGNAVLNVYSSVPGSDLISMSAFSGNYNTPAVVDVSGGAGSVVTFGKNNSNLAVHTSILYLGYTSCTLNLNGGNYYVPQQNANGYIISRNGSKTTLNINGALVAANSTLRPNGSGSVSLGESNLISVRINDDQATTGLGTFEGTITNSTIISKRIFNGFTKDSSLTVTGTNLVGGHSLTDGKVILGLGTMTSFDVEGSSIFVPAVGHDVTKTSATDNISFTFYYPEYDFTNKVFIDRKATVTQNKSISYTNKITIQESVIAVDGKGYSSASEGFAAIKENSVVTLLSDITDVLTPKCTFTLIPGEYTLNISYAGGYTMLDTDTAGQYVVFYASDANLALYNAVYAAYDKNGNLLKASRTAYGLPTYIDSITNGSYVKVKLFADMDLMTLERGTCPGSNNNDNVAFKIYGNVEFDLNGYRMYRFNSYGDAERGYFFSLMNGATLTLYSSVSGAEIMTATEYSGGKCGFPIVFVGAGISATLNVGKGNNNLSVYAPTLAQKSSNSTGKTEPEAATFNFNINGGTYVRTHSDSSGWFISYGTTKINFKNATFNSLIGPVFNADTRYPANITGTIDNCTFAGSFVGSFPRGSELIVTNSNICGDVKIADGHANTADQDWKTSRGSIVLGNGTRYTSGTILGNGVVIEDGGVVWSISEAFNYNIPYYNYTFTNNQIDESSYTTLIDDNNRGTMIGMVISGSSVVTVNWYSGSTLIATQTYINGQTPSYDYSSLLVEKNNTWYTSGGWSLTNGGSAVNIGPVTKDTDYYLVPTTTVVYYQITAADGTVTFGTSNAADDIISALKTLGATAKNTSITSRNATFKLLSDLEVSAGTTVGNWATRNYNIDLNGYRYTVHSVSISGTFTVVSGSTLNIYSSRPGGAIFNISNPTETADNGNGGPLLTFASSTSSANLGRYGDIDGDNLTVYTPIIAQMQNGKSLNIDGGFYHSMTPSSSAVIIIRSNNIESVTVKNAVIIAEKLSIFFAHIDATAPKWKLSVDNTVLYSKSGYIFTASADYNLTDKNVSAEFTNCYFVSNFCTSDVEGIVKTLSGTQIVGGVSVNLPDGEVLVKTNTELNLKLGLGSLTWSEDKLTPYFSITSSTVIYAFTQASADDDNYSNITWKYDGQSITEKWLSGVIPVAPFTNLPDATSIYKFSAGDLTTVNGDKTYEIKQRANFTVLMNLTLYSDFVYNVYLPKDVYDEYIKGVRVGDKVITVDTSKLTKISGKDYYVASFDITAAKGALTYDFTLTIVGYENQTFDHVYNFSIPSYAGQVLDAGYGESTDDLMNTTLAYIQSVLDYTNYTGPAVGDTTKAPSVDGKAQGTVPSNVSALISGAQLNLGENIKFRFNFKASGTVTFKYYVKANGYITETVTAVAGQYYEIALRANDLLKNITITVDGQSCTYGLENYIYFVKNDATYKNDTVLHTLLYNMYAYSRAASRYVYKEPETKITVNGVDLSTFSIVANTAEQIAAANIIKDELYKAVGISLDILSSSTNPAIVFAKGDPSSLYDYRVVVENGNIMIYSYLASFTEEATRKFMTELTPTLFGNVEYENDDVIAKFKATKLYYSDFDIVGDGVTNDIVGLRDAHAYANAGGHTVYADNSKTYYIGDMYVNGANMQIVIRSNVDWGTAKFIIDDRGLSKSTSGKGNVFIVQSNYSTIKLTEDKARALFVDGEDNINITNSTRKINWSDYGYPALILLQNTNRKVHIRYGGDGNIGADQHEIIVVDANGNIQEGTEVLYDYDNLSGAQIYRIDQTQLTINGGIFTTIASDHIAGGVNDINFISRGFQISRSNTLVTNMQHYVTGEVETNGISYNGFYTSSYATDITYENCILTGRRYYKIAGTYEFSTTCTNNVTLKNCIQHNYYVDGVLSTNNNKYWGAGTSNYAKNLTYDGCEITRFDAHASLYNGKIINSKVALINVTGGGNLIIENSVIDSSSRLIYLRSDYGSTWKGTVTIKDTTFNNAKPSSTSSAKSWVISIYGLSWANHDFGYTCHMPNTVIDNLKFANASYRPTLSTTTYYPKVYVVQKANNSTSTGRYLDNNATVGEVTYTAYWYNMWHRTDIGKETLDSITTLRDGTETTTNYNVYVAPDYITVKNNTYSNIKYYVPDIDFFNNTTLTGVSKLTP